MARIEEADSQGRRTEGSRTEGRRTEGVADGAGSLGVLISRLSREALELASAELTVAKAEAGFRSRELLLGLVPLMAMVALLAVGFLMLSVGLVLGLGAFIGHAPAALLVGVVELGLAARAAWSVKARVLRATASRDEAPAAPEGALRAPSPQGALPEEVER